MTEIVRPDMTTPAYVLPMEGTFWDHDTAGSGWNALMAALYYHYAEEPEKCAEAIRAVRYQQGPASRVLAGKSCSLLLETRPDNDPAQSWHWRLSEAPA